MCHSANFEHGVDQYLGRINCFLLVSLPVLEMEISLSAYIGSTIETPEAVNDLIRRYRATCGMIVSSVDSTDVVVEHSRSDRTILSKSTCDISFWSCSGDGVSVSFRSALGTLEHQCSL